MADKMYVPRVFRPLFVALAHLVVAVSRLSTHVVAAAERVALRYPVSTVIHNYPRLGDVSRAPIPWEDRRDRATYVGQVTTNRGAQIMVAALSAPDFPAATSLTIAGQIVPASLETELRALPEWDDRVDYTGVVSPEAARELIRYSRVGLVLLSRTKAYVDALPTKMLEYMAEGTPVVASDFPLWRSILEASDCGVLVDETSPASAAAAVAAHYADPELWARHSRNGRAAVERVLNWAPEGRRLVELYDRLLRVQPVGSLGS